MIKSIYQKEAANAKTESKCHNGLHKNIFACVKTNPGLNAQSSIAFFSCRLEVFNRFYYHCIAVHHAGNFHFHVVFFFCGAQVIESFLVSSVVKTCKIYRPVNNSITVRFGMLHRVRVLVCFAALASDFFTSSMTILFRPILIDQIAAIEWDIRCNSSVRFVLRGNKNTREFAMRTMVNKLYHFNLRCVDG